MKKGIRFSKQIVRRSRKTKCKSEHQFDWLGMPPELMSDKVEVSPSLGTKTIRRQGNKYDASIKARIERLKPKRKLHEEKTSNAKIVVAVALKGGSKAHIEPLVKKLMSVSIRPKSVHLLGMLVAASAISYGKGLPEAIAMGDGFLDSIANTPFDFEVNSSGQYSTHVGPGRRTRGGHREQSRGVKIEVGDNVSVSKGDGKTVFHFDNLNIYFTAQFINEVNIDTKRVIDFLSDQVDELEASAKQKLVEYGDDIDEENSEKEKDDEEIDDEKNEEKEGAAEQSEDKKDVTVDDPDDEEKDRPENEGNDPQK